MAQGQPLAGKGYALHLLRGGRQSGEKHQSEPGHGVAVRQASRRSSHGGGRAGGYTAKVADACVIIPTVNPGTVTPHSEAFQAVIWHLLVSHPSLKAAPMKWESTR